MLKPLQLRQQLSKYLFNATAANVVADLDVTNVNTYIAALKVIHLFSACSAITSALSVKAISINSAITLAASSAATTIKAGIEAATVQTTLNGFNASAVQYK